MHSLKRASFNVTHLVFVYLPDANMVDAELPALLKMIPKIGIFSTPKNGKSSQK